MDKYSFKDILEKNIKIQDEQNNEVSIKLDKIEIPKIQRDYAQGRESQSEVRKRFLNSIFEALENNSEIEMDFIYGSVKEVNADNKKLNLFIPLDGQQRLTTLYLLYWYIGTRELKDQQRNELKALLKKFTYETRTSSRRFCEKLTETTLDFLTKPSAEIKNMPWFYKSYKQDPTIKAMLNMLDAIHDKYGQENKDYFGNLQKLQFYILPLNGFNLTDELYVKMNARGKQLTDFENFKADLIKWMKDDKNPYKTDENGNVIKDNNGKEMTLFQREVEIDGRKMPYYLSISQKIDSKWSKFLSTLLEEFGNEEFKIKETEKGNKLNPGETVDLLFIRLFYRYFLQKYYKLFKAKFEKSSKSIMISDSNEKENYNTLLNEGKYRNFNAFQMILEKENIIPAFEKFFDTLSDNWEEIKESIIPSWQIEPQKWFYAKDITQPQRVIFLAISLFLENNEFDSIQFKQWMRVVWNIIGNTDIDGFPPMYSAMELINEVSANSTSIYSFFADNTNSISSQSSSNAVAEERRKSAFIVLPNTKWEQTFINAEKHPFFKGSVGFIITDNMTENEFKHRTEMANLVFDKDGVNSEYKKDGHLFLRALISRYTEYKQLIPGNYTDTDENEHYLKKMLASDNVVRTATREWFSLLDENSLKQALNDAVLKDSTITGWDKNNSSSEERTKRVHEALYKSPHLQNWMQKTRDNGKRATRLKREDGNNNHIYIARPYSQCDWVMLDSPRNEIMTNLCGKYLFQRVKDDLVTPESNITDDSQNIDYFWGSYNTIIYLIGKNSANEELKLTFDTNCNLKIEKKDDMGNWHEVKKLDYVDKVIDVDNDILN